MKRCGFVEFGVSLCLSVRKLGLMTGYVPLEPKH